MRFSVILKALLENIKDLSWFCPVLSPFYLNMEICREISRNGRLEDWIIYSFKEEGKVSLEIIGQLRSGLQT